MEKRVIVTAGPTCTGKTIFGILLAERLNTEIISADSRQIYKFLDIGTAKPSPAQLKKVKHHFINYLNPDEDYNASKFEVEALNIIDKMHTAGKIPVVVGGSGLYIKAVVDGIFNTVDTDEEYRSYLLNLKKEKGNEYLWNLLNGSDPKSAGSMKPGNWKRIIRALEVIKIAGKPIWKLQAEYKRNNNLEFLMLGLNRERSVLYKNIEERVDKMIDEGLVEETKNILSKGYSPKLNSLNTVGYKEITQYLDGKISLERSIELIKRNTRRYAKRQLTWFRKDKRIKWFDIKSITELNKIAEANLSEFKM